MLMMMMMMKKKKGSLAVVALLVASVNCVINPSKEHLSGEFPSKPTHKQPLLSEFSFSLIHLIQFNMVIFFMYSINMGNSSVTFPQTNI